MAATINKIDALISYIDNYSGSAPSSSGRLTSEEYRQLRQEIKDLVTSKGCHPILVRLAWHDSGTYDKKTRTGGSRACMRFESGESTYGCNAGLDVARRLINDIQNKWCVRGSKLSIADLWCLAATVAIEAAGGPSVPFRFGRKDAKSGNESVPNGRLPDGDKKMNHLRDVFYKMGFNDRDIVILSGAHTLGKCDPNRSGFEGPWTNDKLKFDNHYYKDMLNKKWQKSTSSKGLPQFNASDGTMMLISDLALLDEPETKAMVEEYAASQDKFFKDFAVCWQRLIELGYNDNELYTVPL